MPTPSLFSEVAFVLTQLVPRRGQFRADPRDSYSESFADLLGIYLVGRAVVGVLGGHDDRGTS